MRKRYERKGIASSPPQRCTCTTGLIDSWPVETYTTQQVLRTKGDAYPPWRHVAHPPQAIIKIMFAKSAKNPGRRFVKTLNANNMCAMTYPKHIKSNCGNQLRSQTRAGQWEPTQVQVHAYGHQNKRKCMRHSKTLVAGKLDTVKMTTKPL